MAGTAPAPSAEDLRCYLLGQLETDSAQRIEQWLAEDPRHAEQLHALNVSDTVVAALNETLSPALPSVADSDALARRAFASLTSDQTLPLETVPERLGGYRVLRVLGRGGMGVVYEAFDETLERKVALKVLRGDAVQTGEAKRRFLREARAAASLKSDHIVTVHQIGEADGAPYLAMELLEGQNLEGWLTARPGPASVADVLRVARDVLAGLAVAHAKGVVHRDIKPQNLWVEAGTGRVKILDFGLTRGADATELLTQEGAVLGTPAYMAPEQASGQAVAARADLFSVGVVLYRMLAGKSPFQRPTTMATLWALANDTPAALPGIPPPLAAFIARLLARDPARRPADARAALAELNALKASPRPVGRKPWSWTRIAAGLLGFGVFLAGVVVIIIRTPDGKEQRLEFAPGTRVEVGSEPDKGPPQVPGISSLQALDPNKIPATERFPWQPKELVAVLGEHRARHWGGYSRCRSVRMARRSRVAPRMIATFGCGTQRR